MALDFAAGCVGGCAGVLVGHPFDTVKVRLQTQSIANPMYRGTVDCFVSIIKKESVFGLYKGMASPMYGLAAINAIVFGVQANVQRRMANPDSLSVHFMAGSIAGLAQCIICGPMELAKIKMQTQGQGTKLSSKNKMYKGPVDCLYKIYQTEGIRGTMRGMGLTICRETPSFGAYFLGYEMVCRLLISETETEISTPKLLLAGGCAGMISWFSTYPIDVVKSRIQNDMHHEYKNGLDCFKKTYQAEGLSGFTRGLGATMIRAFPVNAATFTAVAWTLRLSSRYANRQEEDGSYELSSYQESIPLHHFPHSTVLSSVMTNFPSHP